METPMVFAAPAPLCAAVPGLAGAALWADFEPDPDEQAASRPAAAAAAMSKRVVFNVVRPPKAFRRGLTMGGASTFVHSQRPAAIHSHGVDPCEKCGQVAPDGPIL